MKSVLIAHSDAEIVNMLEKALIAKGMGATVITDGTTAFEVLGKMPVTAVMVEKDLPGGGGFEILEYVKRQLPECRVVFISKDASLKAAREALRSGVFDFMPLPLDPVDLAECLGRILNERHEDHAERPVHQEGTYKEIIGQSAAIKDVFRLVDKVAGSDSTVMIYGESGTGKELIARAIHVNSRRRQKALIPVNCGAIPEELLESELFGHEKGAFTSAIRTRIGRFELADTGTIFLDEVADMSPKLQVKILRVLQEHKFERIGGAKTIDVNIRVITATNKNLRAAMEEGRFREDLFYRLNVIPITVPPLRERKEDIPLLVNHFLSRFQEAKATDVTGIDERCMEKLIGYHWPGNIRELENIIERMVILAENDVLTVVDLPSRISKVEPIPKSQRIEITAEGIDFNQVISDFENQLLMQALEKSDWVKNKAAQLLKLNRTTLVEKLKKKGITQQ